MNWIPELRAREGPLTETLALEQGPLGLGQLPVRLLPDATAHAICGYCSTGCNLVIHRKDGEAINVTPDPAFPVNLGMACPKGWEALAPLKASDRAVQPLWRSRRSAPWETCSWDAALERFVAGVRGVQERHGAGSFAFISTGQMVTEEMALLGALAKFGMGVIHGDGNTRQCMATAATAYKQSFGFDAPPFSYADFEESDVIVLVGSNLCIAHPILWQRITRNARRPAIVVVDPRTTETAVAATHHYAVRPKSDLAFFYAVARALLDRGGVDERFVAEHCNGFDAFREFLADYAPDRVAAECGIEADRIWALAELIDGHRGRVSFWWTMGVNQSHQGTRTAQALINLALMTGNIGKPGTGANSITGQCNAMGSRLFSNTTNLLGGHDFTQAADRAKVARLLDVPEAQIPSANSWAYDQIMDGIGSGAIRGLWVVATNTAHSWIHQGRARALLDQLEFLVVQDMFHSTETAQRADLILPAAGWGEKWGTFINSERRIGVVRPVATPPGEALPDFEIFRRIGRAWGCGAWFDAWRDPAAAFQIMKRLSRGQACDISGIADYNQIDAAGGIQWPWPEAAARESGPHGPDQTERRLFEEGRFFHPDGRARFVFEAPREVPEPVDAAHPFTLLTGRGTSAQWHTQTRTGKSPVLRKLYPAEIYVEIHPSDAARCRIEPGDDVEVGSRRGRLVARAHVTATVPPGHLFIPMHYEATNRLSHPSVDPYSRQPAYKASAVWVRPVSR